MPLIRCDNQASIQLIKNPVFHKRTKHIDVRQIMRTNNQRADPSTKPLLTPRLLILLETTGNFPVHTDLI
jgi:hypothetical protein